MKLVKQYNIGKNTEFDLEQLNNDLEPGEYIIKTQGVSKNGKKSPESEGIKFTAFGKGVKIGDYTYRTTLVGANEILKAGDVLIQYDPDKSYSENEPVYFTENGKFYFSPAAFKYLKENSETIFPGWHIPTKAEFVNALSTVGVDLDEEPSPAQATVEDALKEVLNKVGFDTTDWDKNCVETYYYPPTLEKDILMRTSDNNYIMFSNDNVFWSTGEPSEYPQIILCKNN